MNQRHITLTLSTALFSIVLRALCHAAELLPELRVSENRRFLVTAEGKPFFWMGDTGWALFNRLTLEEAKHYLDTRRDQGFNVIQTFLTAPWMRTNVHGQGPFLNDAPLRFNPAFFKHVDAVLEMAATNRQYVLLCIGQVLRNEIPAWQITMESDAHRFGWLMARRLAKHSNVLWNTGQDFAAVGHKSTSGDVRHLVRAMAEGIAEANLLTPQCDGQADFSDTLISFHPNGKRGSGEWFHQESWLAFNMIQTGHDFSFPNHKMVTLDFQRTPTKPIIDSEPAYEGHPASFNAANGRIGAFHVRRHAYWAVFSGAFGHTYGANDIWPFRTEGYRPLAFGEYHWRMSLQAPGARQMKHLRALMESVPFITMLPDPRLVLHPPADDRDLCPALRGSGHALVYVPSGQPLVIRLLQLGPGTVKATWFEPRTGKRTPIGEFKAGVEETFDPPGRPREGNDWVLVLEKMQ